MLDIYVIIGEEVMNEYKLLIVKMVVDIATIDNAKTNYELVCDGDRLLNLAYVLLLLEVDYESLHKGVIVSFVILFLLLTL